ncbi:DgyrCDS8447 [Dimorphilus gyrociliatus]|uniref:Protein farnesyltransferase subunit beta n=1 Tax=Dimorphilus gyrociliatus TaxID=2664684 RepID=A0A7I8VWH5_9ANNE|nr:DgyrCDS8447 [Dimorphilus gyrociliatus]
MTLRCLEEDHFSRKTTCEGYPTETYAEQAEVEDTIHELFKAFKRKLDLEDDIPKLNREKHLSFLNKGTENLGPTYSCLDSSRPWLVYWILNSFQLLSYEIPEALGDKISDFLGRCQSETGGFGGGPGQLPHLASTYAAVCALCIIGTERSLSIINKDTLRNYLMKSHQLDGSFVMHEGGEIDIRGVYCAAVVAKLTNMLSPEMFDNTGEWLASCQTYEGGFGAMPGLEAHGGYSFCGLAAAILLKREKLIDTQSFLRWLVLRQMTFEGGFQGRTNKMVDGCYSFWQGGAFPLIHVLLDLSTPEYKELLFDHRALQEYVLICCQHRDGGLVDKPGKNRDYYHTCYCLSGLSIAQNSCNALGSSDPDIVGCSTNLLSAVHPIFNFSYTSVKRALDFFNQV